MRRLLVIVLAAAGGAVWWFRGRGARADAPAAEPGTTPASSSDAPPRLGGDVDPDLLAILACPLDKSPVTRQDNYLVCSQCRRHYPIRDGIPVMLIDEALMPDQVTPA